MHYCRSCIDQSWPTVDLKTGLTTFCSNAISSVYPNCWAYAGTITGTTDQVVQENYCIECTHGYAVADGGFSCLSYSSDPNCRQLNETRECYSCFEGYYFEGSICTKHSIIAKLTAIIATFFIVTLLN